MFGFPFRGSPQDEGSQGQKTDRKPAAAGSFYPSDQDELRADLTALFRRATPAREQHACAIITPHAGYVYSGEVAASAFNQVDPDYPYERVFVIASSHQVSFPGASIYNRGDYITPLGAVRIDTGMAAKLMLENDLFRFHPEADKYEHGLEVQIPFLQHYLKHDFSLVPIILGGRSPQECRSIAASLKPYFNERNLFVISTDFSHYPNYADAREADRATCDAIVQNDPDLLLRFLSQYKQKSVENLSTNLCGWTSVLTLLYITSDLPGYALVPVQYKNSGDSPYGEKERVVGYWAISVVKNNEEQGGQDVFNLAAVDKKALLEIARSGINAYIKEQKRVSYDPEEFTGALKMNAGAFVTLRIEGKLRGCIGRFTSNEPLWSVVREMSIASATEDTRFAPVSKDELPRIEIEISVLSPLKKIRTINEIEPGKHGIYIKKGFSSGTYLPQVATETGWDTEELLGHCARDKAGIGWDGWKDAEIFIYEAVIFSEKEFSGHIK